MGRCVTISHILRHPWASQLAPWLRTCTLKGFNARCKFFELSSIMLSRLLKRERERERDTFSLSSIYNGYIQINIVGTLYRSHKKLLISLRRCGQPNFEFGFYSRPNLWLITCWMRFSPTLKISKELTVAFKRFSALSQPPNHWRECCYRFSRKAEKTRHPWRIAHLS